MFGGWGSEILSSVSYARILKPYSFLTSVFFFCYVSACRARRIRFTTMLVYGKEDCFQCNYCACVCVILCVCLALDGGYYADSSSEPPRSTCVWICVPVVAFNNLQRNRRKPTLASFLTSHPYSDRLSCLQHPWMILREVTRRSLSVCDSVVNIVETSALS